MHKYVLSAVFGYGTVLAGWFWKVPNQSLYSPAVHVICRQRAASKWRDTYTSPFQAWKWILCVETESGENWNKFKININLTNLQKKCSQRSDFWQYIFRIFCKQIFLGGIKKNCQLRESQDIHRCCALVGEGMNESHEQLRSSQVTNHKFRLSFNHIESSS